MSSHIETLSPEFAVRPPSASDGKAVWELVRESGVLDENSCYLYLLLCHEFAETCLVVEADGRVIAFVTAFRKPLDPTALFVWQIGVSPDFRKRGIALRLLNELRNRFSTDEVRHVEATIAPGNAPSRKLFQAFARQWAVPLIEDADRGFAENDFPPGHEAEPLIRIGPFEGN